GLPRSGDRRELRPRATERRAREDRETRRNRQPEGLPQRDRQLRAARTRRARRPEPVVDELREAARGDREEDVLEHRGAAAGGGGQRQGLDRGPAQARQLRRADGRQGLHREAGAPALRVVPARSQVAVGEKAVSVIIDRRPNDRSGSAVNRERFMRRYRAQIRRAVDDMVADRSIRDMERGGKVGIPTRDISEPVFRHGAGGDHEYVHPGNRDFQSGDRLPRPKGGDGGGGGSAGGDGDGTD